MSCPTGWYGWPYWPGAPRSTIRPRLAELNGMDRRFAALSTTRPCAARTAFGVVHGVARYAPALATRLACVDLPAHEAAAVRAQGAWLPRTMEEGVRNSRGVIDEYRAMVSPVGFRPRRCERLRRRAPGECRQAGPPIVGS